MCELPAERSRVDEVDELLDAVDLDDRDQLAIARLQLLVTVDRDLFEVEAEIALNFEQRRPRPLAEVASLRAVETD